MLNETQLKDKLQILSQNEFRLSTEDDLSELIPAMLRHIGSTDSVLRDDLIYFAFQRWIVDYNVVGPEQLCSMLPIALDEQHLLYRLGEQDSDSVFTRAFSVLLLPLLLIAHRRQPFLSVSDLQYLKKTLLYYLEKEKDRRGFVKDKGWAHATAHAADALEDLAQCSEIGKSDLAEILEVIYNMVCVAESGYSHLEDERIVTAVITILRRQLLSTVEVTQWIEGFAGHVLPATAASERWVIRSNVKNFLQSLYFRLQWEQLPDRFETAIDQTLQEINPYKKSAGG